MWALRRAQIQWHYCGIHTQCIIIQWKQQHISTVTTFHIYNLAILHIFKNHNDSFGLQSKAPLLKKLKLWKNARINDIGIKQKSVRRNVHRLVELFKSFDRERKNTQRERERERERERLRDRIKIESEDRVKMVYLITKTFTICGYGRSW